jgi:hypothetical protein
LTLNSIFNLIISANETYIHCFEQKKNDLHQGISYEEGEQWRPYADEYQTNKHPCQDTELA